MSTKTRLRKLTPVDANTLSMLAQIPEGRRRLTTYRVHVEPVVNRLSKNGRAAVRRLLAPASK